MASDMTTQLKQGRRVMPMRGLSILLCLCYITPQPKQGTLAMSVAHATFFSLLKLPNYGLLLLCLSRLGVPGLG